MLANDRITRPLDPKAAQWVRITLRLLGAVAWLLLALHCLLASYP